MQKKKKLKLDFNEPDKLSDKSDRNGLSDFLNQSDDELQKMQEEMKKRREQSEDDEDKEASFQRMRKLFNRA